MFIISMAFCAQKVQMDSGETWHAGIYCSLYSSHAAEQSQ